jgi:hypothetical protein
MKNAVFSDVGPCGMMMMMIIIIIINPHSATSQKMAFFDIIDFTK